MAKAPDEERQRRLIHEYFGSDARIRALRPSPTFGASLFVIDFDRGARHYRTLGSFGVSFEKVLSGWFGGQDQVTEQSSMDLLYPAQLVFHYERLMSLAFGYVARPINARIESRASGFASCTSRYGANFATASSYMRPCRRSARHTRKSAVAESGIDI